MTYELPVIILRDNPSQVNQLVDAFFADPRTYMTLAGTVIFVKTIDWAWQYFLLKKFEKWWEARWQKTR